MKLNNISDLTPEVVQEFLVDYEAINRLEIVLRSASRQICRLLEPIADRVDAFYFSQEKMAEIQRHSDSMTAALDALLPHAARTLKLVRHHVDPALVRDEWSPCSVDVDRAVTMRSVALAILKIEPDTLHDGRLVYCVVRKEIYGEVAATRCLKRQQFPLTFYGYAQEQKHVLSGLLSQPTTTPKLRATLELGDTPVLNEDATLPIRSIRLFIEDFLKP